MSRNVNSSSPIPAVIQSSSNNISPTKIGGDLHSSSAGAVTKLCHIVKSPDFEGYGFNLHSEKMKPGQYIGKVDEKSPAEAAGLKEGDRIIEVNGLAIGTETHKQVVQRIKAIEFEVRLLLIDVDAIRSISIETPPSPITTNDNGQVQALPPYQGIKQEMPGASANISSISMISTKRMSNGSGRIASNANDATDKELLNIPQSAGDIVNENDVTPNGKEKIIMMVPKEEEIITPKATIKNSSPTSPVKATIPPSPQHPSSVTTTPTPPVLAAGSISVNSNTIKAGSLNLPMTAAEMRAKLMSKKKYDPKNESVDLKKKFEIIQKL